VYGTPSGGIEGENEDIGEVLECSDAAIRKGVCSNEVSKKRER
jgi:hypothetical protein